MATTPDETTSSPRLTEAERNLLEQTAPLYKFVFTGGPCGGKTTALARAFGFLRERGFQVITIPEAYTLLSSNGMSVDFYSTEGIVRMVQSTVMDVQMALEDSVARVLRARGKPAIMLCDRGTMDGAVYVSEPDFQKMMEERNTNIVELRDKRYDGIMHMVTAADGAEAFYSLENNKVRTETRDEAIEVDRKTQKAWVGHPHLYVLDNSTDFEGKMTRLIDIVSKIVGLPSNLKRRSAKFLLLSPPDLSVFPPDIDYQVFEVEKVYMTQPTRGKGNYSFIRRRTFIDSKGNRVGSVFQMTKATRLEDELIEEKRIITEREYAAAHIGRDVERYVVQQRRISFLYEKQSFTIHIYEHPSPGLCILHAQVEASSTGDSEVELPPFLNVDRQLQQTKEDEDKYGAYSLSIIR